MIIYKDKLICENPNSFRTNELLTLKNYTPFAKNSYLYSGKPPIFEDKEMFRVTIPLLREEKLDEKDLINLANDTLNDTLNLLKTNPNIIQKNMAIKLQVSEVTIKRNIKELKEKGYIERVGSKKSGYWKILKDN